jgi:hypothetical protein
MPATINTFHIIFTLLATGLLFGLGFSLAQIIVSWPAGRVAAGAALIGALILLVAWLV